MDETAATLARALAAADSAALNDTLANATDTVESATGGTTAAASTTTTIEPFGDKWIEELWKKADLRGRMTSTPLTTTTTTDPDWFRCGSGGALVARGRVCDGYSDCFDDSDEQYKLCGYSPCDKVISFPKKCDDGRCNFDGRCDHSNLDQFGVFWYVVLGIIILLLICCVRKCQKWLDTPTTQQQRPTLVSVPPYANTPPPAPAPATRPYPPQPAGQAESVPLQHVYDALRHSADEAPEMPPPSYEQAMAMSGAKGSFV